MNKFIIYGFCVVLCGLAHAMQDAQGEGLTINRHDSPGLPECWVGAAALINEMNKQRQYRADTECYKDFQFFTDQVIDTVGNMYNTYKFVSDEKVKSWFTILLNRAESPKARTQYKIWHMIADQEVMSESELQDCNEKYGTKFNNIVPIIKNLSSLFDKQSAIREEIQQGIDKLFPERVQDVPKVLFLAVVEIMYYTKDVRILKCLVDRNTIPLSKLCIMESTIAEAVLAEELSAEFVKLLTGVCPRFNVCVYKQRQQQGLADAMCSSAHTRATERMRPGAFSPDDLTMIFARNKEIADRARRGGV